MKEESTIKTLLDSIPQVGKVQTITIRPERREMPREVESLMATSKGGLEGDHFSSSYSKKRQVTLIQSEHLEAVASILQTDSIDPLLTRRNILVSGINLLSLMNRKFSIGGAVMQCTGYCEPCSRMEENFGPGGYNAMRGHGGITAEIIEDGEIKVGDDVRLVKD